MNDEWLNTVMELMSEIIITVYCKEKNSYQDTTIIEEEC